MFISIVLKSTFSELNEKNVVVGNKKTDRAEYWQPYKNKYIVKIKIETILKKHKNKNKINLKIRKNNFLNLFFCSKKYFI